MSFAPPHPWNGFLNVLKPPGMTSHDVVDFIRRLLKQRRIGHTGTLDPAAAGVLPICVGVATRLSEYVMDSEKEYRAEIILGMETDTNDLEGQVLTEREVSKSTLQKLHEVLSEFVGEIEQVPPSRSALKFQGRRFYQLARAGEEVPAKPRKVKIYEIRLVRAWMEDDKAKALLDIKCGKGMYVRALARDIGRRLGVGACQAFLVRKRVGPFRLEEALTIEDLRNAAKENKLDELLLPLDAAVQHFPQAFLSQAAVYSVIHGNDVSLRTLETERALAVGERVRLYAPDKSLIGIGLIRRHFGGLVCHPEKVFIEA